MNTTIEKALNKQLGHEFFTHYSYLAIAAYAAEKDYPGFASWFHVQAKEENDHAMGIFNYILERGGSVSLDAIKKPKGTFKNILDCLESTLKLEKETTEAIHSLYELALTKKDYALQSFLRWYIDEQVEEESLVNEVLAKYKLAGSTKEGLYLLDQELGKRVYTPSSILGDQA